MTDQDIAALLKKLAKIDTPTICNVIELFDVRPRNQGFMDGRIKATYPNLPPMVGFACTASFRSDAPPGKGDAYGSIQAQLEQFAALPGPSVVVIQDLDDAPVSAVFGEVMCSSYQAFGSVGLVTNGAGRDLQQIAPLSYPTFTNSSICSHGYCHLLHLGMPVRIGGLMVNPGDLLHGDANGITNIPLEIVDEVADISPEFLAAEEIVLQYVKSSETKTVKRYAELRNEFQAVVNGLGKRVSRKP